MIDKEIIIILVYVDDALFTGSNPKLLSSHKKQFMKQWESRDLGEAKEYLGIQIIRDRKKKTITLDQATYALKVIKRFGLENCRGKAQPLPSGYKPSLNTKTATPTLRSRYQSVIGSLLYIMLGTRPDLGYSVIKMSQFSANPSEEHLQKALHIVHYLSTTTELCIRYSPHGPDTG